jgi:hypothetical protein
LNKRKNDRGTLPQAISLTLEEAMQVTGGAGTGAAVGGTTGIAVKPPIVVYGLVAPDWKGLHVAAQVSPAKAG